MRPLRRKPADDGLLSADDLRLLLAAAGRRVVELETANAALQGRLDRAVAEHEGRCPHLAQRDHALELLHMAKLSEASTYRRSREVLAQMRGLRDPGPTMPLVLPVFRDREG